MAPGHRRPEVDDLLVVDSSDLWLYILDTGTPDGELDPLAEEEAGQDWQAQRFFSEPDVGGIINFI